MKSKAPSPPFSPALRDDWGIAAHARELQRIHERLSWQEQHGPVRVIYSRSTLTPPPQKGSSK